MTRDAVRDLGEYDEGGTCEILGCECTARREDMREDAVASKIAAWLGSAEAADAFERSIIESYQEWAIDQIRAGAWKRTGG